MNDLKVKEPVIGYFVNGPKGSIIVLDKNDVEYYRYQMAMKDLLDLDDITATKVKVEAVVHPDAVVSVDILKEMNQALGIKSS